jgi:protoporphyrinogen oxidase
MGGSAVIVGAGVAGLTAARQLARAGWEVTVVELEDQVGGLARSFHYNGHTFDIGPHRFHTDDPVVLEFIDETLGDDKIIIDRSSGVWFFNRYHDWPLTRKSIFKMPFRVMVGAFLDLFLRRRAKNESFEQYILSLYGKTLFRIFFKPYTEKFLRYPCHQLHSDWASAGINRAVIDKRYQATSLFKVIKSTLFPKPVTTKFIYPASGGVDVFCRRLAGMVEKDGGRVHTGARVSALATAGHKITGVTISTVEGERHLRPDLLVWTAPPGEAARLLELPDRGLEFLSVIAFNYEIEGPPQLPYQWTYYGADELTFNRASIPANFAAHTAPPGYSGICIELACMEGDGIWNEPEHLRPLVERDMLRTHLVRRFNEIVDLHIERIRNTYPIYTIDYRERLQAAMAALNRYENLLMLGRTGTFWYNNMDHSIRQALDLAALIASGGNLETWREQIMRNRSL